MLFKDNKIDLTTKLTKDSDKSFSRKNVIFKVILKDKKGSASVIAQSVWNIADMVYMPTKGKQVFDQKVSLKFHKSFNHTNVLKQGATLNLNIKSMLKSEVDPTSASQTAKKTYDGRTNFDDSTCEQIVFDADQTLGTDMGNPDFFDCDSSRMSNFLEDLSSSSRMSSSSKHNAPLNAKFEQYEGSMSYRSLKQELDHLSENMNGQSSFRGRNGTKPVESFITQNSSQNNTFTSSKNGQNRDSINSEKEISHYVSYNISPWNILKIYNFEISSQNEYNIIIYRKKWLPS